MIFNDLIKDSVLVVNGCVNNGSYLRLGGILSHNNPVFSKFEQKVLVINKAQDLAEKDLDRYVEIWKSLYGDSVYIRENAGHQLGAMFLEEFSHNHVRQWGDKKFMWKFSDDWLITENFLKLDRELADFYYLPAFSYESILMRKHYEFNPQTNFYIVNLDKSITLYGDIQSYVKKKLDNPGVNLWDIPHEWKLDCETTLGRYIKIQGLETCNILTINRYEQLIHFVEMNKIGDPSHKEIFFEKEGLCHFHSDMVYYL